MDPDAVNLEEKKIALQTRKRKYEKFALITACLTPNTILRVGYFFQRSVSHADRVWKTAERRAEQRERGYVELGPLLNIIYCYVDEVGDYARYTPREIVEKKRSADRLFHTYLAFWSEDSRRAYADFMQASFDTVHGGMSVDAKIRVSPKKRQQAFEHRKIAWDKSWDDAFTPEVATGVREKYLSQVNAFLGDLEKNDSLVKNEISQIVGARSR